MRVGKIPENVLKRSVLKQIKYKREDVQVHFGAGEDGSVFEIAADAAVTLSTSSVTGHRAGSGIRAVLGAVNELLASGAEPVGVMVSIFMPELSEEADLKALIKEMEQTCEALEIEMLGVHAEVSPAVSEWILSVTGSGKVKKGDVLCTKGGCPGQDIVLTKAVGLEGTAVLASLKETELCTRYSQTFVGKAKDMIHDLSVTGEAAAVREYGVSAMHAVAEGGIFAALWDVAAAGGTGLQVELKKVPLCQETVEVCEFFDLNPYQLLSGGCLMILCDKGYDLVDFLEKRGIRGAVIGKLTDDHDKIIVYDEEETRYLEPPKADELYKVIFAKE